MRLVRKIRHCKTCEYKCDKENSVIGCQSIMAPVPPLQPHNITHSCIKRIWFDKNHNAVEVWDSTKITEDMTPAEFEKLMDEEVERLNKKGNNGNGGE